MTTIKHTWGADWRVLSEATKTCDTDPGHGSYSARQMKHRHSKNPPYWTNCPQCDAVWQGRADAFDQGAKGGASPADQRKALAHATAGIPKRYRGLSAFEWTTPYPQMKRFKATILTYIASISQNVDQGIGMVMSGPTGTGKTHLACCILQECIAKGGTARYTTTVDMVDTIASTYSGEGSKEAAIATFTNPDLLVLDEVGRESGEEHSKNLLFRILDKRNHDRKPTIVCSNLSGQDLADYLGAEMLDRLKDGGAKALRLQWPSLRGADYETGA